MKIISSYFGNRILKHVESDMKELSSGGFTGVVHTFTENDLRYYSESFKDIVRVSHEAGLDVDIDPWGVGCVFGGEAFSMWIAENPDQVQVSRDGSPKPLACFNSRRFRDFMKTWVDAARDTGATGLFWDEPHLYIPRKVDNDKSWTCTCDNCRRIFKEKYGTEFPDVKTKEVIEFQHWTLVDFLSKMRSLGNQAGMRNTVCLLPDEFVKEDPLEWSRIVELPHIDIISTDPYWLFTDQNVADFVGTYSTRIKNLASEYDLEGQIWIQGFRIPSSREDEIRQAIETASNEGIKNLAIWGFEACEQMSHLACGNSKLAWQTAIKAFQSISE